ncbi:hypothetical protein BPAE_0231g00080 [Botrytis paeoniae]|uniref:Uncharacterized protein n=1 Tax=Botrytis paeoniae TaxID=278948 RepID=A0A4Z1FEN8_9HELO|nr:hypothetical protein BPAE_0231g00080 [Botrytis paeoniae]
MLLYQLPFASVCNKSAPASKVMLVEGCVVDNVVVDDKFSKSQSCKFDLTEITSEVTPNPISQSRKSQRRQVQQEQQEDHPVNIQSYLRENKYPKGEQVPQTHLRAQR